MALNFIRHWINPSLQQRATWLDSAWTAAAIDRLGSAIKALAAVHDEHLSAGNPHKHLLVRDLVIRSCKKRRAGEGFFPAFSKEKKEKGTPTD